MLNEYVLCSLLSAHRLQNSSHRIMNAYKHEKWIWIALTKYSEKKYVWRNSTAHSSFITWISVHISAHSAHTYRYCVFGAHSYALSPGVKCIRCVSNASSIKLIQIFICWCIKCVCPTEQAIALRQLGTLGRQYNKREYKNISLHKWAIFFRFFSFCTNTIHCFVMFLVFAYTHIGFFYISLVLFFFFTFHSPFGLYICVAAECDAFLCSLRYYVCALLTMT